MNKKYLTFGAFIGIYYCIQFMCCVSACNMYSDTTRTAPCILNDGTVLKDDDASKVFDIAIKLLAIYHITEWVRTTILLVVVCIGVNLMHIWYLSSLVVLYAIPVFVYIHFVYASEEGIACGEHQHERRLWLMVEIIYFWVIFWVFQVPFGVFRLFKREKLFEILNAKDESDDD